MYIVKREGLWLMSYLWLEDSEIPVGLWGSKLRDAKVFEYKAKAQKIADRIGKCEIYEAQEREAR